jgi:hypothetical protein
MVAKASPWRGSGAPGSDGRKDEAAQHIDLALALSRVAYRSRSDARQGAR